jgi:FkbM family methyltransferase
MAAGAVAAIDANRRFGDLLVPPPILVSCGDRRVKLRARSSAHLDALDHIFVQGAYSDPRVDNPRVILDLGGNVGFASVFFACRYPAARIICVEPAETPQKTLRANIAPFSNIEVVQVAVTDQDGTVNFYEGPTDIGSSLSRREGSSEARPVQGKTLRSLLREAEVERVDLLKVDIEGAEWDVLRDLGGVDARMIIAELHLDLCSATLDDFRRALSDYEVEITEAEGEKRFDMTAFRH